MMVSIRLVSLTHLETGESIILERLCQLMKVYCNSLLQRSLYGIMGSRIYLVLVLVLVLLAPSPTQFRYFGVFDDQLIINLTLTTQLHSTLQIYIYTNLRVIQRILDEKNRCLRPQTTTTTTTIYYLLLPITITITQKLEVVLRTCSTQFSWYFQLLGQSTTRHI